MKNDKIKEIIESSILREKVDYRGGGVEIDLSSIPARNPRSFPLRTLLFFISVGSSSKPIPHVVIGFCISNIDE